VRISKNIILTAAITEHSIKTLKWLGSVLWSPWSPDITDVLYGFYVQTTELTTTWMKPGKVQHLCQNV